MSSESLKVSGGSALQLSMVGASSSKSRASVVDTELSALSDLELSMRCLGFLCALHLTSPSQLQLSVINHCVHMEEFSELLLNTEY